MGVEDPIRVNKSTTPSAALLIPGEAIRLPIARDTFCVVGRFQSSGENRPMKKQLIVVGILASAAFSGAAHSETIDFEQFNVGDDLATVNAGIAALGVTFDAAFPETFEVVLDPGDSENKVIRAKPYGAAGAVDFVANFTALVESVSVEFVTNPDPVTVIVLEAYGANQIASAINVSDYLFQDDAFLDSGTLEVVWAAISASPTQIRAATMGVASDTAPAFNYIDNLTFVPEPSSTTLQLCAMLMGACLRWSRRD
jgi:hypothetical protein